jgi:1-deoxy-D-xylulose-5-phosphate reductoisomerase
MVEYVDGSMVAQMGITDMKVPISYALSFPERLPLDLPHLDLPRHEALNFSLPDLERFPCLKLAYQSIQIGETMPAVLNAANEIAVGAFLEGSLKFTEIPLFLQRVMGEHEVRTVHTVEEILRADHWARERSKAILERGKAC